MTNQLIFFRMLKDSFKWVLQYLNVGLLVRFLSPLCNWNQWLKNLFLDLYQNWAAKKFPQTNLVNVFKIYWCRYTAVYVHLELKMKNVVLRWSAAPLFSYMLLMALKPTAMGNTKRWVFFIPLLYFSFSSPFSLKSCYLIQWLGWIFVIQCEEEKPSKL